jgi:hypothetical protein
MCSARCWPGHGSGLRFAVNERLATTLGFLAECFETLGGVPAVVLADRMGCLKAGTVADVVVPTADGGDAGRVLDQCAYALW